MSTLWGCVSPKAKKVKSKVKQNEDDHYKKASKPIDESEKQKHIKEADDSVVNTEDDTEDTSADKGVTDEEEDLPGYNESKSVNSLDAVLNSSGEDSSSGAIINNRGELPRSHDNNENMLSSAGKMRCQVNVEQYRLPPPSPSHLSSAAAVTAPVSDSDKGVMSTEWLTNEQPVTNTIHSKGIVNQSEPIGATLVGKDINNSDDPINDSGFYSQHVNSLVASDSVSYSNNIKSSQTGFPNNASKRELISKSTLETHKLDLMAEISNLKLKLASSERERKEMQEKFAHGQRRIDELQSRLNDRTIEVTDLRNKLARSHNGVPYTSSLERSESVSLPCTEDGNDTEIQSLQKAVESLMSSNSEKDKHIEELKKLIRRYKKIEEMVLSSQGKKALELLDLPDNFSDTSSTHNSTASSGNENTVKPGSDVTDNLEAYHRPHMPYPNATSTPVNSHYSTAPRVNGGTYTPPSAIGLNNNSTKTNGHHAVSGGMVRSNSAEDLPPLPMQTPPTVRRRGPQGFADAEQDEEALKDRMAQEYKQLQAQNVDSAKQRKNKGLKNLFGKLKRSNSQELDDQMAEFKRGGVRSTATGRLGSGWSRDNPYDMTEYPFSRWDGDRVATWLHSIGLSMYVGDCKRWVKHGDQLLRATSHELEKEMGMKNVLHRKKLQLALQAMGSDTKLADMDKLDYTWVTRWLDDIGLPQYKDVFSEARIDGRMLHHMTVDDLSVMKITSAIHHLSIKTGIQVLRLNRFNPNCLKRRPLPDEGLLHDCPQEVILWTNHRVMEWLRSIDLSEYAPNLRGSGVHGGLMVLEAKFPAELFASILSITPTKTLLRRHLTTHFVTLVGSATQARKREMETQQGYIPLTPGQKVKQLKKGIFSHRRTRSESEGDYVCPMNEEIPSFSSVHSNGGPASRNGTLERTELYSKERYLTDDNLPTSNV